MTDRATSPELLNDVMIGFFEELLAVTDIERQLLIEAMIAALQNHGNITLEEFRALQGTMQ